MHCALGMGSHTTKSFVSSFMLDISTPVQVSKTWSNQKRDQSTSPKQNVLIRVMRASNFALSVDCMQAQYAKVLNT